MTKKPITIKGVKIFMLLFIFLSSKNSLSQNIFPPLGNVGIGTLTPTQLLQLNGGNLDFVTTNSAFMIGGARTIWRGTAGSATNIFVGANAGTNTIGTGLQNTFVGNNAGASNLNAANNTFIGFNSGTNNTTATRNTYVGSNSGSAVTTILAFDNTFMGMNSGLNNISGNRNVFVGSMAGQSNTTARQNTFVGFRSGFATLNGEMNTFVGNTSGDANTTGSFNTYLGDQSGPNSTTGNNNVFLGRSAGMTNIIGSNNTLVGTATNMSGTNFTNASAIGYQSTVNSNGKMILGNNAVNVGIGLSNDVVLNGPQNKLEIDAGVNGFNPTIPGNVVLSGLRLRDLASNTLPIANPGTGVLSVNLLGDVIYVPVNNATTLGNICASVTPNPLATNWEIPLNNNNFVFSGQGTTNNNVGIGTSCTPNAKLYVVENSGNVGSIGIQSFNFDPNGYGGNFIGDDYGISAYSGVLGSANQIGVFGQGTNGSSTTAAIKGNASSNAGILWGVLSNVTGSPIEAYAFNGVAQSSAPRAWGIKTFVQGATIENYGGQFLSNGTTAGTNYGVYAQTGGATISNIAVYGQAGGAGANDWAGYFLGNVFISGTYGPSDINMKENIDSISNALSIIQQLNPKTFDFKTSTYPTMGLSDRRQYGLIAQEVEAILPELVGDVLKPVEYDSSGAVVSAAFNFKTLNYQAFTAILIKGMQEQQENLVSKDSVISALRNNDSIQDYRLTILENAVNECCNNRSMNITNGTSSIDVELKDGQNIVLEQNTPNPFAEQSTINYFLPDNVVKAQMLFYNIQGKLIQSVELTEKGKGSLNVFAQDLSNGIYTYTLVVDGKVFETKKMVKQK